jgi:hypothetical protein
MLTMQAAPPTSNTVFRTSASNLERRRSCPFDQTGTQVERSLAPFEQSIGKYRTTLVVLDNSS